jgi:hypothetical protein
MKRKEDGKNRWWIFLSVKTQQRKFMKKNILECEVLEINVFEKISAKN